MSEEFFVLLKSMQLTAALFLSVGCFLGFPNDPQLSGAFWAVTVVTLVMEVIDRVLQNRKSRKGL